MDFKRDYQIDLMKIISCIFVVSIHFFMDYRIQINLISYRVLFIENFTKVCVPIFICVVDIFCFKEIN